VALPDQRGNLGHLCVKGASVIDRYFNAEEDASTKKVSSTPATSR
jgi:hypothetical protein